MIGVYQILNTATGDSYVGASVDVERRWSRHKSDLRLQRHKNRRLQDAWSEHGAEKFVLNILQRLTARDNMDAAEQWYIDTLAPVYNIVPIAAASFAELPREYASRAGRAPRRPRLPEDGHPLKRVYSADTLAKLKASGRAARARQLAQRTP